MLKILFQGDSLTDCGRDKTGRNRALAYGCGYVNLIASRLMCDYPDTVIYNKGVDGSRIVDTYSRWVEDALNIDCNILSILNGVNDIGFSLRLNQGSDPQRFKKIYKIMLDEALERNPDVKLVLGEPFLFKITNNTPELGRDIVADWDIWSSELNERRGVVCELAKEYNAVFVPYYERFQEMLKLAPPEHWSLDCIHVTHAGNEVMARLWLECVKEAGLIK